MSGHSKWATIKHKKGAADKARAKVFNKIARQLEVAAREKQRLVDLCDAHLIVDEPRRLVRVLHAHHVRPAAVDCRPKHAAGRCAAQAARGPRASARRQRGARCVVERDAAA